MKNKIYYAKSELANGSKPTVAEHLNAVAQRAALYGEPSGLEAQAHLAGRMHDFGKYSSAFQDVLAGTRQGVDHASCGAAVLRQLWTEPSTGAKRAVIEAVNAHHSSLKSGDELYSLLRDSLKGNSQLTINSGKQPALNGIAEYQSAMKAFRADHPDEPFTLPRWNLPESVGNLETMLYTRMLFSCLVDADYSVSAWEADHSYFQTYEDIPLDAQDCLNRLNLYRDQLRNNAKSNSEINRIRDLVFERCGACGEAEAGGLFTLTAPTGTGKTLALLHFALRHALATGKRRIIIVLPFLTLAEQNAAIYSQIIPSVLVDHSQSRLPEEMWEYSSKWNVPFIITTSVKFFETLFASTPSDCRKLHSFAQSVVVFDEAQSLPPHLTAATLKAVNEMCARYQMTMVFSTATQPAFGTLPGLSWAPKEVLPENKELYEQLRRVTVDWQLKESTPLDAIAKEMLQEHSVCGIFNLRRHARAVFEQLSKTDPESAFLISTDLCPAHRTQIVAQIRSRLAEGLPCRVSATQCIEAGVDLDFQALYRALAPLEAIIQAAGRCNRNGSPEKGRVTVFEPADSPLYPDDDYGNAAKLVKEMAMSSGVDLNAPEDIARYYARRFAGARDKKALTQAILERSFKDVDRHYRLISDTGEKLIVPFSGMLAQYNTLREALLNTGMTPGLMKQSAPLTITVFNRGGLEQFAEPVMIWDRSSRQHIRSGYWLLRKQYETCYSDQGGFTLPDSNDTLPASGFLY